MATITCPNCGTENDAARTYCHKCAAELKPPPPPLPPVQPLAPPPVEPGIKPWMVVGGIIAALLALGILALIAMALFAGTPAATIAPTPSAAATAGPTATPVLTSVPTEPPATPGPTVIPAPRISAFTGPKTAGCGTPGFSGTIQLAWRVQNAPQVTISIDGPGVFDTFDASLGGTDVPYACDGNPHTYLLTTVGGTGKPAQKQISVKPS